MDTEPSTVQEMEKFEETDQKIDPEPIESIGPPNVTRVSALDMILKSLSQLSVFAKELAQCQERFKREDDESVVKLHDFLHNNLTLTNPMESNGVSDFFVTIMELLPRWRRSVEEEPLNSLFQVHEVAKKTCNRCKAATLYPVECSYGQIVIANSLREIKSQFKNFTFENIVKVIKMTLKMPCENEGCGKLNYVNPMITKLPSVFTIGLEWEHNETGAEIFDTASLLPMKLDISAIYQYEGHSALAKYRLVSMVCLCGDQYNCVAFEKNNWVKHFGTETEIIGNWDNVLSNFVKLNIRPQILFFEKLVEMSQLVFGSLGKNI